LKELGPGVHGDSALVATTDSQRDLVHALQDPARYPHPVEEVTLLETHISYVLLTGLFAYKIKKAVNLGFLDFTRLEQRRNYCAEEFRLNCRLVPELYLSVIPIFGTADAPRLGNGTEPEDIPCIEYAVKMLEFPQSALLDRRLAQGELRTEEIDALAGQIADFHAQVAQAGAGSEYVTPAAVWALAAQNFSQLPAGSDDSGDRAMLNELETWSRNEFARLEGFLESRRGAGFVRECHGDLHLGNIALVHGTPKIFDCIEFNANLRWIDVISEVAFLSMDLEERGRPDFAHRFLNRYLEATGDYAGLQCLPFFRVYRALVRAKVAGIRAAQEEPQAAQGEAKIRSQYLAFASRASRPRRKLLLLMHGVSGSGKTRVSESVLEHIGALRLRSDIERKRLCGLPALARSAAAPDSGLYDAATTRATYHRLEQLAQTILDAGFTVVIDAASLQHRQREIFRNLARALNVPFRILSCRASETALRQRILAREQAGTDASDAGLAILTYQLQTSEPLSLAEQDEAIVFDSENESLEGFMSRLEEITP
jgi:hypothetical protein